MKIIWHYQTDHLDIDTGELFKKKPENTHYKIKTLRNIEKSKYNDKIRIVKYTTIWRRKSTQLQIEYGNYRT